MKNERQQSRDLRILSAYLDDVLNASQKEKLEARLIREPELRQTFENLRRTKRILSSLPRVKSPHNFTLTPEMVSVRQPKRSPFVSTLRLATSFAAILLVALFGFELLVGSFPISSRMVADAPVMESYKVVEEASPQPLIHWGGSQGGYGGGMGGGAEEHFGMGDDSVMSVESYAELESFPVEEMVESQPVEELPAEEIVPEEMPAAELESPYEEESLSMLGVEEDLLDSDLILGINVEQAGEVISQSPSAAHQEETGLTRTNLLRWVQLALGAIVLAGIITLIILQSRSAVRPRLS